MPVNTLRRLARRLMHPFPRFPYLACHVLSPTDARAERIGLDCTEALFAEQRARPVVDALVRFLDDCEAERALKKEYHRVYEERLRAVALAADPTETHGMDALHPGPLASPLDGWAAADLGVSVPLETRGGTALHWLSLLVAAAGFLGTALSILLFWGRTGGRPVACRVAAPNFWHPAYWSLLQAAAEEAGLWHDGDLLFVLEDSAAAQRFVNGPFPSVDPSTLPVPRGQWLRLVLLPGLALVPKVLLAAMRGGGDARVVELAARALNVAARSLAVWRVAFNVRCRWYLDTEHNSALHNLRGIILRKFGSGVVRWAYSQNESPGVYTSFLGYDLFLSGGPFQYENYRQSWYPGLKNVSVGQIRNDRRMNGDANVAPDLRDAIESRLARGERMAVYFGGNLGVGFDRPMRDSLAALLAEVANREGWFLVIKPKFREGFYDLCATDSRLGGIHDGGNVLAIHYPKDGAEVCPAGWLIDRMSLGLTLPGSVQFEALTSNRVMMAYWPTTQDSVTRRGLRDAGLLHEDPELLGQTICRFLEAPEQFAPPLDWVRQGFDPFADDRALDRVAAALFADDDEPRLARQAGHSDGSRANIAAEFVGVAPPMSLSLPHRVLQWTIGAANRHLRPLAPDAFLKAAVKVRSDLDVVAAVKTPRGIVRIFCDSETIRARAEHMPTREPATLAWIEGFQPDEVLWDIGSNIGVFSLYAAIGSKARVVAFDPLPFNYAGFSRNLALNGVTDRVQAFCCAISDVSCATRLHIPAVAYTPGGSGSTIGADPSAFGLSYKAEVSQSALQFSVDDFLERFDVPFPNYLKLDIDGVQDKVIMGARKTLRDPRLKSAMLELPPNADMLARVHQEMADAGFVLDKITECAPGGGTDATKIDTNQFFRRPG